MRNLLRLWCWIVGHGDNIYIRRYNTRIVADQQPKNELGAG